MMAPYTMCHLKLGLTLAQTGYKEGDKRLSVYLTNSLEEGHEDHETLFASWLSEESNEASRIKKEMPIMVVMGNPPYSGESANKGEWIEKLMADYKKDDNGQKIPDTKWLNNDYVKFLRYGQYFIEKNESGVLAFITDNSFLDSISFRGMRWSFLKTYDKIYSLNLHGNSKKKEVVPDGSIDVNVFDIMQGVSVSLFVKTGRKKPSELSKVFQFDLYGKREMKYNYLFENSIKSISWNELSPKTPNFFLVPKNFSSQKRYDKLTKIDDLFYLNGVGICSKRDETAIKFSKKKLVEVLNDFKTLSAAKLKLKYKTEVTESRDKKLTYAKENIEKFGIDDKFLRQINYRPFDKKWTYFTNKSRGFLAYPVYAVMQHFTGKNLGLVVSKKSRQLSLGYMFITNEITDLHILDSAADSTYIFPIYIHPDTENSTLFESQTRKPNLNPEIITQIAQKLNMEFVEDGAGDGKKTFGPEGVLDYIYAVLHSPTYREKYKEFLKIDFPRVPFTEDKGIFWKLVALGRELRGLHLLESEKVNQPITGFPIVGDNTVVKVRFEGEQSGKVWFNDVQYFDKVPRSAWEFYIGGYQPAQKWLKDRKGRKLSSDDIEHYQKIIVALTETDRIMKEVDKVTKEWI